MLSITAEADGDIHLHPGGQGIWVARMIARMRVPVVLCSAFGGETGTVVRALAEAEGVRLEPVTATESNGAHIEFSGDGERPSPVRMPGSPLRRHTIDDLYGASLARGLAARDALRLGIAAGLLNTTRRGLGTGRADDIAAVARRVRLVESAEVDPVSAGPPSVGPPPAAEPVAADRVVAATQQGVRRADEEDAGAAG